MNGKIDSCDSVSRQFGVRGHMTGEGGRKIYKVSVRKI
jgi:hypothetical protein